MYADILNGLIFHAVYGSWILFSSIIYSWLHVFHIETDIHLLPAIWAPENYNNLMIGFQNVIQELNELIAGLYVIVKDEPYKKNKINKILHLLWLQGS